MLEGTTEFALGNHSTREPFYGNLVDWGSKGQMILERDYEEKY